MITYRLIGSPLVDPPVIPTAHEGQALAAARMKAVDMNADRRLMLRVFAREIESWVGRLLWRGSGAGGARAATSEVEVAHSGRDYSFGGRGGGGRILSACPSMPDLAGVTVAITSVERWDDSEDPRAYVTEEYHYAPGGAVAVARDGVYRVVASLTPPAATPEEAVEALARLWAIREQFRPGDFREAVDIGGAVAQLSGAVMKSGAAEILRTIKRRLVA